MRPRILWGIFSGISAALSRILGRVRHRSGVRLRAPGRRAIRQTGRRKNGRRRSRPRPPKRPSRRRLTFGRRPAQPRIQGVGAMCPTGWRCQTDPALSRALMLQRKGLSTSAPSRAPPKCSILSREKSFSRHNGLAAWRGSRARRALSHRSRASIPERRSGLTLATWFKAI